MGAKSVGARAANRKARQKMNMSRYAFSKTMIRPEQMGMTEEVQIPEMDNKERICQKCGFKARYPFIRCPECNEVQK